MALALADLTTYAATLGCLVGAIVMPWCVWRMFD
jgi:hypothetical protein